MIEEIKSKLQRITQGNGYLFNVTDIKEQDTVDGLRPRGIAVEQDGDQVKLHINAASETLSQLADYCHDIFSDDFDGHWLTNTTVVLTRKDEPTGADNAAT